MPGRGELLILAWGFRLVRGWGFEGHGGWWLPGSFPLGAGLALLLGTSYCSSNWVAKFFSRAKINTGSIHSQINLPAAAMGIS